MIVLTETTDTLQVVLAGSVTANQLRCMTSWRDITTTAYTPGRTVINTNNTTDVSIVGSPASSTQRVVDFISIYNADTAAATVTVKFDANGTEYILFKGQLAVDERLEYQEGQGFKTFNNQGAIKSSINQGNSTITSSLSSTVLASDVTNNNGTANTIADVTGLSFAVTSGNTYWFRFIIWYTSAATTTGSRWAINGPANTLLGYRTSTGLSAAGTAGTDVMTDVNQAAYDTPAASNATSPTATAGQANIAIIEGLITPSANGTVIARFASEVSSSAIIAKAGSVVYYQQVV
jgi:hypothetical protein